MIDFSQKTYANLRAAALALVPNIYDKRDGSMIGTAVGPMAYLVEGVYLDLNVLQQGTAVSTSGGQELENWALLAGTSRQAASPAVRLGIFNVAVPIGARFSTIAGADSLNFYVSAATDTALQYQLTCETPGEVGNSYSGPITPVTYVEGLTSAQITDILIPGEDEETDESLRSRVITALNERPFGGNIASYREGIMAIEGVGAVQIYPVWNGGGTVKASILGADFLPASEELVETVQNAIDPPPNQGLGLGLAPIGAQFTAVAPDSFPVNVSATLTLESGYDIGQVQDPVEAALENYLLEIRKEWDTPVGSVGVDYAAAVYVARVISAIVSVPGVANATGVQLNGGTADLTLTETGATQQVPTLGTVTLSA